MINLREIYSRYNPEPVCQGILWINWHEDYCKFLLAHEPDNRHWQYEMRLCKGARERFMIKHWETTIRYLTKKGKTVYLADKLALKNVKQKLKDLNITWKWKEGISDE